MDDLRIVIAELELTLIMLQSSPPDAVRIKALLNQAHKDLERAIVAITGQNPGAGEN